MTKNTKPSRFNIISNKKDSYWIANTLSKSVIEIRSEEWDFVKGIIENKPGGESDPRFNEYKEALINNGFLIDKNFTELNELEKEYNNAFNSSEYLNAVIIPTFACNFSCSYCFEEEKAGIISDGEIKKFLKFQDNYYPEKKRVQLNLFGGEPLVAWNKLEIVLEAAAGLKEKNSYEFGVHLATNGYLLTEEIIKKLIEDYYCESFQVTIDANRKSQNSQRILKNGSGTYETVIKNFKTLLKYYKDNLNIVLRVQLLNNSIEDVNELLAEFTDAEKERFAVYFRPITKTSTFRVENENKHNLEDFYKCAASQNFNIYPLTAYYSFCPGDGGKNKYYILPDMSLVKCVNKGIVSSKIGKIDDNGYLEFDDNVVTNWARKDPFKDPKCRECIYLPSCYGGCPWQFLENEKRSCFYEMNFDFVEHLLSQR